MIAVYSYCAVRAFLVTILITFEFAMSEVDYLEQSGKTRGLMVTPFEGYYSISKWLAIVDSSTDVDDMIGVLMFVGEKGGDVFYAVSEQLFESWGWVGHGDEVVGDVGEI